MDNKRSVSSLQLYISSYITLGRIIIYLNYSLYNPEWLPVMAVKLCNISLVGIWQLFVVILDMKEFYFKIFVVFSLLYVAEFIL